MVEFTIFPEVTGEVSPDSIVTEMAVDVFTNNNASEEPPAAEEDDIRMVEGEEETVMDQTMEVTQQASTPSHSEDFNTIYSRCFNNNNNSFSSTVKIGERIITILGDCEELVGSVGSVVNNYFNVTPLSEEDSGEAALLHSTIGQDMPGPEVASEHGDRDMETAQEVVKKRRKK